MITAKGYERVWFEGRLRMEPDVVWEKANGPIPDGFELHHRDEDKLHNVIENLQLVTDLDHKRMHSPHYRRDADGRWERLCRTCGEWKLADVASWYFSREGWLMYGQCRPCRIAAVVLRKQTLRAAA